MNKPWDKDVQDGLAEYDADRMETAKRQVVCDIHALLILKDIAEIRVEMEQKELEKALGMDPDPANASLYINDEDDLEFDDIYFEEIEFDDQYGDYVRY